MARFGAPAGISDVLAAPLGDLIAAVGRSVAEAQHALDDQTIEHFRAIYADGTAAFEALRAIGYQPTWYQIPEATAEIAIALTASTSGGTTSGAAPKRLSIYGAPVDAAYQSKYNFNVQATSSLKFRVVPVPPPTSATRLRIVPSFIGRSLADARALALEAGVELVLPSAAADNSAVTGQAPAAGSVLPAEAAVTLTLAAQDL